ncbi:ion channel [Methylomonas sp. MgM2]
MNSSVINNKDERNKLVRGGNFFYLFLGLILILLILPFADDVALVGRYSVTLLFSLFMLISVWSMADSRRIFEFGIFLIVGISFVEGAAFIMGFSRELEAIGLGLMLIFCSLSTFIAGRNVFVMHQVDLNSLIGAFCVYLLIGMIWALLFRILHLYGLASFTGNINEEEQAIFPDLVYFSFVTLASLGYGDIAPVSGLSRTLAYLETVVGQFYLAVMVASLVGVYSNRRVK